MHSSALDEKTVARVRDMFTLNVVIRLKRANRANPAFETKLGARRKEVKEIKEEWIKTKNRQSRKE